ncbi:MAG: hypothetical protein OEW09_17320 [Anaerolineae bacterium]|nr:hypothetical protein [Anaerolineae bacterium]
MNMVKVELVLPQDKYDLLADLAQREDKSATELSLEMLVASIEQEAKRQEGYKLLLSMADTAGESGLTDLARRHDHYLYGEERTP